jgi:integrase/recombinase XerD
MPNPRGRPAGTSGQAPVLSSEQIKRVVRTAKGRPRLGSRAVAILSMSLALGLRAKELAALTWGDVFDDADEVRQVLHLRAAYTKGTKTRDLFLVAPKLRQVLETYRVHSLRWLPTPGTPLFASQRGGHLRAASLARFLKQLYREAGLPGASSHTGRRTFITNLAEQGIDLKAISILAGHANIKTTARYVETSPAKLSRILAGTSWLTF